MKHFFKSTILVLGGFILAAGSMVFAATWQGTTTIQDGQIISAWDFLSDDDGNPTHVTNNISIAAPEYCDENGENCVAGDEVGAGFWSQIELPDYYGENEPAQGLFYNDGPVGIGTTSPNATLAVAGRVGAREYCDENGENCINGAEIASTGKTKLLYNGSPDSLQTLDVSSGKSYKFFGRLERCDLELKIPNTYTWGNNTYTTQWQTIARAGSNESSSGNNYSNAGYYSFSVHVGDGNTGVTGVNTIQTNDEIIAQSYNGEWNGQFRTDRYCQEKGVTVYEI
jgi:hypothetical protein